jgi:hypothetical protein
MNATEAIFKNPSQTQDIRDNMVIFCQFLDPENELKMTTLPPVSCARGGISKFASMAFITITLGVGS